MGHHDWYRRTTWSQHDREEFQARLERSQGSSSKAQYLRIQAWHLAEAGHFNFAIELLDQMLTEYADPMQLAMAHLQKADCWVKLGQDEAVVVEYCAALQSERELPNVQTFAYLDFGCFSYGLPCERCECHFRGRSHRCRYAPR